MEVYYQIWLSNQEAGLSLLLLEYILPNRVEMMFHPRAQAFLGNPRVYALIGETGHQGSVALKHVCMSIFSVFPEFMLAEQQKGPPFLHASPHIGSGRSIP